VFAYNCQVNQGMITVKEPIPFDLNVVFDDPNL
jgi:sugar fermentation stimulation protein A